jgi:hypothetical protein
MNEWQAQHGGNQAHEQHPQGAAQTADALA